MSAGRAGWRALGWFWVAVIVVLGGGGAALQAFGPPAPRHAGPETARTKPAIPAPAEVKAEATNASLPSPAPHPHPAVSAAAPSSPWPGPPIRHSADGQIAPPNPAMLEPAPRSGGPGLPRRAADGGTPMQAYARKFDTADPRPRIALVLDGIGLSGADSQTAIDTLPGAVTLAISAYAPDPAPLLERVRAHGHEYLASLPMEPQGYPLNDAGADELLSGASAEANQDRLEQVLGRIAGYVGVTSASDGLRGERYAAMPGLMATLAQDLADRGLLYVDARPGGRPPASVVARGVDLVIDEQPDQTDIDARLTALEQIARDHGSALGLAGPPRPVTVARIAAWASTLERRGFVLAPVSAIAAPTAARQDAAK